MPELPGRAVPDVRPGWRAAAMAWVKTDFIGLFREFRLAYLPPLMVYLAAGVSGLTGIVGTFFVKDYLGLSAAFLSSLAFWAGIPWTLKMPIGHLVDLFWRYKAGFVYLGAILLAASLAIMAALILEPASMRELMPIEHWFVLSSLLAPVGYVLQDAVADAMTVEAVPRVDAEGRPFSDDARKRMNTTMQTLGRVAIVGGGILVSVVNVIMFEGVDQLAEESKAAIYARIYLMALVIPAISVAGVLLASWLRRRARRTGAHGGSAPETSIELTRPNGWILGGSLVFVAVTLSVGLSGVAYSEELIFGGSMLVIGFMMSRLMKELEPSARNTLLGTAIVIFVFRALPGPGPGATWWQIDALGFDARFLAQLSLIASVLTLIGLVGFRLLIAERSIIWVIGWLTIAGFVLGLPTVGLYYGLHNWTSALTGGVVDARFIVLLNTAVESPLGQIAMVPMLAWIANSAPAQLKATFFAVMASFTNLALSASQLGTKYLNLVFDVRRGVLDPVSRSIAAAADYSELGRLLIVVTVLSLVLPFTAIGIAKVLGLRSA